MCCWIISPAASFEPSRVKIPCSCVKKAYGYKIFWVYFTYLPRSPPCADLHEILHEGSSRRRNQPCQIFISIWLGVLILWGSNFWLSHKKEKSTLTHGLNYRSACDNNLQLFCREPRRCSNQSHSPLFSFAFCVMQSSGSFCGTVETRMN